MATPATTTTQAPSWLVPFQQYGLDQSLSAYQNPGQLVAPFAPQQEQAISGITGLTANGGGAPFTAAGNYLSGVLNGNPATNPFLDSMFNQGANAVQNRLSSEFAGMGRNVESSLPVQADQLNNLATQLYGGAYNTGVQQQMGAAQMSLPYTQQAYQNFNNLFGVGQQVQGQSQRYIQAPQDFLNQYLNRVNGYNLGQTTTATPAFNPLAGAIGGAGIGYNIGNSINSDYGGLLGSIAGGLLGAYGG
jgi:hypothetical protein